MLDNSLNASINLAEFENGLKEEFNNFYRYIEDCNKFNHVVQESFDSFKAKIESSDFCGNLVKKKFEEEFNRNQKRERESVELICELKESYDRNITKLREHHKRQLLSILEKHKSEVKKWKSRCDQLKSDQTIDKQVESGDALVEQKFLEKKLARVSAELASFRSTNESLEQELSKFKNEKKILQEKFNCNQKEHSKFRADFEKSEKIKAKEISQLNGKIKDLELTIKTKEEIISEKTQQLRVKEEKLQKIKSQDSLPHDFSKLKNGKSNENIVHKNEVSNEDLKSELAMTKIELRAANRDLGNKTDVCSYLRKDIASAKEKIAQFEDTLSKERQVCKEHLEQIEKFKSDINNNHAFIKKKDDEIISLKYLSDENSKKLDLKLKELNDAKLGEKKWKDKCVQFEKKQQFLLNEIESAKRKAAGLKVEIDRKNVDIEHLIAEKNKMKNSYQKLQIASNELESQVREYDQKFTHVTSAKKSLIKQKCSIDDAMANLRNDLDAANEKSNKLEAEKEELMGQIYSKDSELNQLKNDERINYSKLQREYEIEQDKCQQLEDRIIFLEEALQDAQENIDTINDELENARYESRMIKEEASRHITSIRLAEKKCKEMEACLREKSEEMQALFEEIEILKQLLESKDGEIHQNSLKTKATLAQQMKLIDFLKTKAENKKKAFISINPKFFVADSDEQRFEEMQKLFNSEKFKNFKLNEQIKETNLQLEKNFSEVAYLKNQIYELKNQIKSIEGKRKFHSSTAHDIPHRFNQIKVKFSTLCVSCAKQISFGQKAKKCQDCESTIHVNCSLVNNCCMPVDVARKVIHQNADNYSLQSYVGSDSSVEPSAPNISPDASLDVDEQFAQLTSKSAHSRSKNNGHFTFTPSITDLLNQQ